MLTGTRSGNGRSGRRTGLLKPLSAPEPRSRQVPSYAWT